MLEMNNAMLNMVCGGNFGDCDKDTDPNHPWYQVGETVKYYEAALIHFLYIQKAIIRDRKYEDNRWYYKIEYYKHLTYYSLHHVYWITASDIER